MCTVSSFKYIPSLKQYFFVCVFQGLMEKVKSQPDTSLPEKENDSLVQGTEK